MLTLGKMRVLLPGGALITFWSVLNKQALLQVGGSLKLAMCLKPVTLSPEFSLGSWMLSYGRNGPYSVVLNIFMA